MLEFAYTLCGFDSYGFYRRLLSMVNIKELDDHLQANFCTEMAPSAKRIPEM